MQFILNNIDRRASSLAPYHSEGPKVSPGLSMVLIAKLFVSKVPFTTLLPHQLGNSALVKYKHKNTIKSDHAKPMSKPADNE